MSKVIVIRDSRDRLRYVIIFEAILIVIVSIALAMLTDNEISSTGSLTLILSSKAMVLNFFYNNIFDRVDVYFDRIPTERSTVLRMVHAVGFESTLVVTSLPIVMWWLDIGLWAALKLDIMLMLVIVIYTYCFSLSYDKYFPVPQEENLQNAPA